MKLVRPRLAVPFWCLTFVVAAEPAVIRGQHVSPTDEAGKKLLCVTPEGQRLRAFLDGMAVDRYWLRSHDRIQWETGEPFDIRDGKILEPLSKEETHCSAFVAAAAQRLGIYVLRPPDHSHILLADAQYDWLHSERATAFGWHPVQTALEAQQLANRGAFVVAVAKNSDPKRPGHIAVVAPCEKPVACIAVEGPEVCQAGVTNYRAASLQTGFSHHPGAWQSEGTGTVRFFANSADPKRIGDVTWREDRLRPIACETGE